MKHEDNFPTDPELEARIVAWVLGEASPFEAAELERKVAADPALEVFRRRIEAVHGLVGAASRPPPDGLRLSADRRAKVLAVIGAPPTRRRGRKVMALPLLHSSEGKRFPVWLMSLAACVLVGVFSLATFSRFGGMSPRPHRPDPTATSLGPIAIELPRMREREEAPAAAVHTVVARPPEVVAAAEQKRIGLPVLRKTLTATSADKHRQKLDALESVKELQLKSAMYAGSPQISIGGGNVDASVAVAPTITAGLNWSARNGDMGYFGGTNSSTLSSAPVVLGPAGGGAEFAKRIDANGARLNAPTPDRQVLAFAAPAPGPQAGGKPAERDINDLFAAKTEPPPSNVLRTEPFDGEEVLTMSPFEVSADRQGSYMAMNTLSGSRVALPLKDFAASMSVTTKNSLADTPSRSGWSFGPASGNERAGNKEAKEVFLAAGAGSHAVSDGRGTGRLPLASGVEIAQAKIAGAGVAAAAVAGSREGAAIAGTALNEVSQNKKDEDKPVSRPAAPPKPETRAKTQTATEPISTFSLHVSDVSFQLARAALAKGQLPESASVRPEEFYNAFDYGDPSAGANEPIACRIEQAAHPFQQETNLVRIAVRVPADGRAVTQPLRLTVLLDTSGSMEREDRVVSVRRAFESLASLLSPSDQVTLIGFARHPRLLADRVAGNQTKQLLDAVNQVPAEGGTNLEDALKLAGDRARAQFDPKAQNRIVVLSDGAANLGNDNPAQLAHQIETLRQAGIAFDACGIGIEGLDDSMLEELTRKGDGRYYVVNSADDADAAFARKLAGALRPAAENVKVQVRFNPARVTSYRLLGFEQHRLRTEDFRNDKVDAAELAGNEAAVAVYEVQVQPEGEGELGDVFVRFRQASNRSMVERSWTMLHDPRAPAFDRAAPSLQLAGTAALLAQKLQGGDAAKQVPLKELAPVVNRLRGQYAADARVQEFVTMFEQTRRILGE